MIFRANSGNNISNLIFFLPISIFRSYRIKLRSRKVTFGPTGRRNGCTGSQCKFRCLMCQIGIGRYHQYYLIIFYNWITFQDISRHCTSQYIRFCIQRFVTNTRNQRNSQQKAYNKISYSNHLMSVLQIIGFP